VYVYLYMSVFLCFLLWPPFVADADIIFSSCGFFILFFLAYSQRSEIGCLPYFHTWWGLSANWECRSEMCCTRLAEIQYAKITQKNRHLCTIAHLCRAISSQLSHVSTIGKKPVKQQYLLHMSSQHGELRPTNGWDWLASLRNPCKFQRVSRVGFVTAPTSLNGSQRNFAWCLAFSWAGTLYIHFWARIARCKIHFASKFCVLLYWQYYCSTALEQWSSAKLCDMVQGMELRNFHRWRHLYGRAAITLGIGPHF